MSWHRLQDPENPENRNAGNGGDLVKHTVYLAVLDHLLARSPWAEALRIRECHAGRGMYAIPATDPRRRLLEALVEPVDRDVAVSLHDAQRCSQELLSVWPETSSELEWYSGSAVLNAWRLGIAGAASHRLDLYELASETRSVLRAVFRSRGLRRGALDVRIFPEREDGGDFDGESYIRDNIAGWDSRDLILLDPFAMWRQPRDQHRRDRYRQIVEGTLARGTDSPQLILFWTWGRAFPVAEGDLTGTNEPVTNGYQELRELVHREGRHFIRVTWRWGLQFAIWVLVPERHLEPIRRLIDRQCRALAEHLLQRSVGSMSQPTVEVLTD